jgi:hypothetical protein
MKHVISQITAWRRNMVAPIECPLHLPQLEARPTRQSYGNQWLQRQLEGAPNDGHNSAWNMLSGVYATKQ